MKKNTFWFRHFTLLVLVVLGVALTTVAQEAAPERGLEGAWVATFTPRSCATGEPLGVPVFQALLTFHKGGTISVWSQQSTITVTRSPFHGTWERAQGWNEYSMKYVGLQYNLTTGAFGGRQEARGSLVLSESGNEFTAESISTVFFASGAPPASACSTSVATRFE